MKALIFATFLCSIWIGIVIGISLEKNRIVKLAAGVVCERLEIRSAYDQCFLTVKERLE